MLLQYFINGAKSEDLMSGSEKVVYMNKRISRTGSTFDPVRKTVSTGIYKHTVLNIMRIQNSWNT